MPDDRRQRTYGKFIEHRGTPGSTAPASPPAGRIIGLRLLYDGGQEQKPATVTLQIAWAGRRFSDLRMPFVEAMALLTMLRAMQLDTGFELPDDPRAPSAKARH